MSEKNKNEKQHRNQLEGVFRGKRHPVEEVDWSTFLGHIKEAMSNPDFFEVQMMMAKARKSKFDALVKQGFSEEQAISIIAKAQIGDFI